MRSAFFAETSSDGYAGERNCSIVGLDCASLPRNGAATNAAEVNARMQECRMVALSILRDANELVLYWDATLHGHGGVS